MRIAVIGAGAVGSRAARQLASTPGIERLVVVDQSPARAEAVVDALGDPAEVGKAGSTPPRDVDVVLLAVPGPHRELAEAAIAAGTHVVSAADGVEVVRSLLALDPAASAAGTSVAVGAAFAPGLTCLLARHGATGFDAVEELHVAKSGTGGPACAREHHQALKADGVDWRDGQWVSRPAGSGRELVFFPDPVGGRDCYRASLPDPLLLAGEFPGVQRVTVRVAAKRRDRMTARLPMLRPPHPEGMVGAVRVEIRGRKGTAWEVAVLGAMDRPAVAAGCVAALTATWIAEGRITRRGAAGLAGLVETPVPFLHDLAQRGIKAAVFEGA